MQACSTGVVGVLLQATCSNLLNMEDSLWCGHVVSCVMVVWSCGVVCHGHVVWCVMVMWCGVSWSCGVVCHGRMVVWCGVSWSCGRVVCSSLTIKHSPSPFPV